MVENLNKFRFVDFGASNGGSIKWASGAFGGSGFGIDIDEKKIRQLTSSGLHGIVADATALDLPDNSVSYATMINFLEHLPNKELGERMLESAIRVAADFVFILGPDFEGAHYLKNLGFKKYFADWSGHTWHHRTHELVSILGKYDCHKVQLIQFGRLEDSYNICIQPLEAKRNCGPYNPFDYPRKNYVKFDQKLYGTIMIAIVKNPNISIDRIFMRSMGLHVQHGQEHNRQIYLNED